MIIRSNFSKSLSWSWVSITLWGGFVLAAYCFILMKNGWEVRGYLGSLSTLTLSEVEFLLLPYLSLAYFRQYAAETFRSRWLAGFIAFILGISALAMTLWSLNRGPTAGLDFFFHSSVAIICQSGLTLMVLSKRWLTGLGWEKSQLLALMPTVSLAAIFSSHLTMMGTGQVVSLALALPYIFWPLERSLRLALLFIFAQSTALAELWSAAKMRVKESWPRRESTWGQGPKLSGRESSAWRNSSLRAASCQS